MLDSIATLSYWIKILISKLGSILLTSTCILKWAQKDEEESLKKKTVLLYNA